MKMFKNYLKITMRNIMKHKGYSFINIFGLAIGMACCLMISLWVLDELSYDKFHTNVPYLYRVEENQNYSGRMFHVFVTPHGLARALVKEIPEIKDAARYSRTGELLFRYGEKAFFEINVKAVDPSFLQMFTFPLLKGDKNTALSAPQSLVISEDTAKKYFGNEDPIGKTIAINNKNSYQVTGVMRNVPHNSYLQFDALLPYEFLRRQGVDIDSWDANEILTFVQLHANASKEQTNQKVSGFLIKRLKESQTYLELIDYTRLHLYEYFGYEKDAGAVTYIYILSIIALFVLLIACINFMNLATARSVNRAREVGLRKVMGALKGHLIRQFYGESIIFSVIALIVALVVVQLLLPSFSTLAGKEITFRVAGFKNVLLLLVGIALFTGIVAGSYPALFLSAFQPVKVLNRIFTRGSNRFRRTLVVGQFVLSVFLIIGTIVVSQQLHYLKNKNLGYSKNHIFFIPLRGAIKDVYQTLKIELKKSPNVLGVTGTRQLPTYIGSTSSGADWDGKDPNNNLLVSINIVDYDFVKTLGIQMAAGREFTREFPGDNEKNFLINEEMARIMEKNQPVGERLDFVGFQGKVVGVMKNFHYEPAQKKIEPIALALAPKNIEYMLVRIAPDRIPTTMEEIAQTWKRVVPAYPFDYHFLGEIFDRMYRTLERSGTVIRYFTLLTIFIACLGLFGLASFSAEKRTREIGIRKALGATVSNITVLLCREFLLLVSLAIVIAWPLSYLVMAGWLQDFAYRISLNPLYFILAMVFTLFIALFSVVFQALRASNNNPVKSLHYE
jgi:ABC-type antimicrobial peptide transport system permease subunit